MRTIEELSTQLEELEKRLKMVTTSQSVLSLLNNINVYINNIQAYLSDLNDNYDAHLIDYQTLSDLVAEIEERVKTLEENGGGSSSESNADLSEITSSLEQLETRLNTLIGDSTYINSDAWKWYKFTSNRNWNYGRQYKRSKHKHIFNKFKHRRTANNNHKLAKHTNKYVKCSNQSFKYC